MKKTLFLLSVVFLLMAATPAWPASTNYPMPDQKWPDTVQAWPSDVNAWPYPSHYPFPANTGYPYPISNVA